MDIKVTIQGREYVYPAGTPFGTIAADVQKDYAHDIVLVLADGRLRELEKRLNADCELVFYTTADAAGCQAYRRSLTMLLMKAVYKVAGHENVTRAQVQHSVSSGYYCTVEGSVTVDEEFLRAVKAKMLDYVGRKLPIKKTNVNTDKALRIFHEHKMYDKERLFRYRRASRVNLYSIGDFEDYYYGYMVPHTGYLKYFELYLYDEGFVLQFPTMAEPERVPPFTPQHKVFQVLKEATKWGDMLGISTVGDLNDCISRGGMQQLIMTQEALQERRIAEIASRIAAHAADIAKGLPGAREQDDRMAEARHRTDWEEMFSYALDGEKARRYFESVPPTDKHTCSMCGKMCAMRTTNQILEGKEVNLRPDQK